jgi:hypothetical protein
MLTRPKQFHTEEETMGMRSHGAKKAAVLEAIHDNPGMDAPALVKKLKARGVDVSYNHIRTVMRGMKSAAPTAKVNGVPAPVVQMNVTEPLPEIAVDTTTPAPPGPAIVPPFRPTAEAAREWFAFVGALGLLAAKAGGFAELAAICLAMEDNVEMSHE